MHTQHYTLRFIRALIVVAMLSLLGAVPTAHAAIITVSTFDDDMTTNGNCTLREAIQAANTDTAVDACPAGSGSDTIQLASGNYTLSLANISGDENSNQTGDLDILSNVIISGVDTYATLIDAGSIDRVIHIQTNRTVTLNKLSLSHGSNTLGGGGIYNDHATLTLNRVAVMNNTTSDVGGGIYNDGGTITMVDDTIGSNTAANGGAGIENNNGTINITSSLINNNTTTNGNGAGIRNNSVISINSSSWIHDNYAHNGDGAGIYSTGTLTFADSSMNDNYAFDGNGGNIYSGDSSNLSALTISGSSIVNGHAASSGGGIYNDGALSIVNTTLSTSRADAGAGLYNVEGIQSLNITNTTVVSNTSSSSANGPSLNQGDGISNQGAPITLKNTIVAYNGTKGDCFGPITSAGHNLELGNTCSFNVNGDLTNTLPRLGPFQDNGGRTYTYALLSGSPAINAGTNIGCPATDQRGVSRPHGSNCDIGSYETNTSPSAIGNAYVTDEDTPLVVNAPGVLANDSDVDGDTITTVLVSGPSHGTLTLNANGSFSYTPSANYYGSDSFSYRASDGAATSGIATVTLTINSVNDAPVAVADAYSVSQDTLLLINAPGVLANDSDVDGDALGAVLVSGTAHGTLTLNTNGSFSYTPNAGYVGSDSFSYYASDGAATSATTTVTLTVNHVNKAPVAGNDTAVAYADAPLTLTTATLLSNDSDGDGDPLSISAVQATSAHGGSAVLNGVSIVYTPPLHYHGPDSFTYTLSDGHGGIATGTVNIQVRYLMALPLIHN